MGRVARHVLLASVATAAFVAAVPSVAAAAKPVWLCKPGLRDNPCRPSLRTTLLSPSGQELGVRKVKVAKRRRVDCFYVYPTVTEGPEPQAPLEVVPVLRSVALYQAARFSRDCRVFAPVYRQATISGVLGGATAETFATAYRDVLNAWRTYLKKHNRGRGVVLIGHSQGTSMLMRLAAEQIDRKRRSRKRLVSGLLLGWPATVKEDRDAGGTFNHIRACRGERQIGCVVAYSMFNEPVPDNAIFGRTSQPGLDVVCTNPAALRGGPGKFTTIYPTEPFAPGTIAAAIAALGAPVPQVSTPWVQYKGAYSGQCSSADDANVLQVADAPGAPHLNPVPTAGWGLHFADVNLPLGNLTDLVRKQARRFVKKRR